MPTSSFINRASDLVKSGRESEERRTDHVLILILVDTTAPRTLAVPVRDAFDPRLPGGEVRVHDVTHAYEWANMPLPDACVAICANNPRAVADEVTELALDGVPVAIIVESVLDAPRLSLGMEAAQNVSVVAGTNAEVLSDRLAEWLISVTDKSIACAANFVFCRRAKVRELTKQYAIETAMGTAQRGGTSDLGMMVINYAQLALSIAAVNGEPLALRRIPEVMTAVGAGFGSRMMADKALGKIPLVGTLAKAGFEFLGAEATGMALQARFDKQERKASGAIVARPSLRQRAFDAARKHRPQRERAKVSPARKTKVRLLPDTGDGGFLLYELEDQQ